MPVLVTGDEVLGDSSARSSSGSTAATRPPSSTRRSVAGEARRIETWLDEGLGPDGRLWMYDSTLPMLRDMRPWALAGVPRWERRFFVGFGWALDPVIRRYPGRRSGRVRARPCSASTASSTRSPGCSATDARYLCGEPSPRRT